MCTSMLADGRQVELCMIVVIEVLRPDNHRLKASLHRDLGISLLDYGMFSESRCENPSVLDEVVHGRQLAKTAKHAQSPPGSP